MRRFLSIILVACSLPIVAHGKTWRGIVPLRSTRADVERLLGPGNRGHYQFDEERAHVNYAEGECNPVNGCLCLVPKDKVISIYVQLEVEMSFSKLNIDQKDYEKFVSRKDPNMATYSNDKEGIIYTVNEENDDVTAIEYSPTAKDCQDVLKGAKRARVKGLCRKALRTCVYVPSSLSALPVLHDEGGHDADNVLLLTSWETRDILKTFFNLPDGVLFRCTATRPPLVFSKSTISTPRTSGILRSRSEVVGLMPPRDGFHNP